MLEEHFLLPKSTMASTSEPAGPPPQGITLNFDNPQDTLYPALIANSTLSVSLTTIFVFCRLVARGISGSYAIDGC